LLFGTAYGHQIAKHIQRTTEDVLQIEHGSLRWLEHKGWVFSNWETAGDRNREFNYYYRLGGRKQLVGEESEWTQLASAIARVTCPAQES
jgi:DNA-binding PadR family transcriptional regulator